MNPVEEIYLSKLSQFHSVLQRGTQKGGAAAAAFEDILSAVEQRMGTAQTESYNAAAYIGGSCAPVSASTREIDAAVQQAAAQTGLNPALIYAVIQAESSFRPDAVSSAGAEGLMQLMPGTAASLGVTDSFDVYQNVMGGSTYLKQMLDRFGDVRLALAAYNTGPGRIGRLGITDADDPSQYTQISERVRGYVDKVLSYYEQYAREV